MNTVFGFCFVWKTSLSYILFSCGLFLLIVFTISFLKLFQCKFKSQFYIVHKIDTSACCILCDLVGKNFCEWVQCSELIRTSIYKLMKWQFGDKSECGDVLSYGRMFWITTGQGDYCMENFAVIPFGTMRY